MSESSQLGWVFVLIICTCLDLTSKKINTVKFTLFPPFPSPNIGESSSAN